MQDLAPVFARVARRYRCCGRGAYGYVKGKLKHDPVHRYVLGLAEQEPFGNVLDLGSGRGHSVNAILKGIERVTGRKVPARFAPRRPGDPPAIYADATRAARELGFRSEWSDLDVILKTAARGFGLEVRP